MELFVLGEFWDFVLNCEENLIWGIGVYSFFRVVGGGWRGVVRRGDQWCVFRGIYLCQLVRFCKLSSFTLKIWIKCARNSILYKYYV
jgi:hypothetical protein